MTTKAAKLLAGTVLRRTIDPKTALSCDPEVRIPRVKKIVEPTILQFPAKPDETSNNLDFLDCIPSSMVQSFIDVLGAKPALIPHQRGGQASADACYNAMERHHERQKSRIGVATRVAEQPVGPGSGDSSGPTDRSNNNNDDAGDILYGARAIARFLFNDDSDAARKRVFEMWAHLKLEPDTMGFFKPKETGTLCLSKRLWWEAVRKLTGRWR